MRFNYWTTPGQTHIQAILEDGEDGYGKREEGAGTLLHLEETTATFDYEVKEIHPDVLGLLCMVLFYPFIGDSVEFPKPVSPRLKEAFTNPCFLSRKTIEFRNLSTNVPLYCGSENMALSFGGGIDSTAVRAMFPEAFIVHEAHIKDGQEIKSHSTEVVHSLGKEKGTVITTNARYMSMPGGWHTWPCSTCTSLLLATDMQIGIILTGSILGSSFLWNGSRFWDRLAARDIHGPSGNYWQSAFEAIGLPMYSPVTGVSEFQTMALSLPYLDSNEVVYCQESDGHPCFKCTKCFRRDVIRGFVASDYQPNWENYTTETIRDFLAKRPLYFGHIFSTATSICPERFPEWLVEAVSDGVQTIERDWAMRCYTKSFELCPAPWSEIIQERVLKFIPPMSVKDIDEMRSWSQSVPESKPEPETEPKPKPIAVTQSIESVINWRQEGNHLWMDCEIGSFYWDMPRKWKLENTHPDLLKLAEWVLLDPWVPGIITGHEWSREPGKRPGLSFSGGIESTAALLLMPRNTAIAYHERDFESMLKHDNAKRFIKRLRWRHFRKVTIVKSNHERIRTHFGKANGFSTDLACAVHLILLADYLDLDSISVGMPIDNSWLNHGRKFRDFPNTHWYKKWTPIFKEAGLEIILPVNMISQAGCLEVVQAKGLGDWAQSCLRAPAGETCGRCWKCFFKNSLLGHSVDTSSIEIQKFSSTDPLKTAAMVLYATKKTGLFDDLSQLKRFSHINLDWFNQIYPPGFRLLPNKYQEGIRKNLIKILSEMKSPYPLESTDLENPPYSSGISDGMNRGE